MASTQANTWPPLIGPNSYDAHDQRQLYGEEVLASALIVSSINDEFFHPVNRGLTGYSFEGILYQNGAEVPAAPRASWALEAAGPLRGEQRAFPRVGIILATDAGLSILDTETAAYSMWMVALRGDTFGMTHNFLQGLQGFWPDQVTYQNGRVLLSLFPDAGAGIQSKAFVVFDFVTDQIYVEWAVYKTPSIGPYLRIQDRLLLNTATLPNTCPENLSGGKAGDWSIVPLLPAGLLFNKSTGEITGTPTTVAGLEVYTVTASNKAGEGTTTLILDVRDPATIRTPVKFAVAPFLNGTFVVMSNGELWGTDTFVAGQSAGALTSGAVYLLHKLDIADVADVQIGQSHLVVLKTDGTVWTKGSNMYGQYGIGNRVTPAQPYAGFTQASITDVTAIAALEAATIALKANGEVWTWGSFGGGASFAVGNLYGNSLLPENWNGLTGVTSIAAYGPQWVALQADGSVWAYPELSLYKMADGTQEVYGYEVNKVLKAVCGPGGTVGVARGNYVTYLIQEDGTVLARGWDDYNQPGGGSASPGQGGPWHPSAPQPVMTTGGLVALSGVIEVAAGIGWALFLKADGSVYGCGDNHLGPLGLGVQGTDPDANTGMEQIRPYPALSHFEHVAHVGGAKNSTVVIKKDGTMQACGFGNLATGDAGTARWDPLSTGAGTPFSAYPRGIILP